MTVLIAVAFEASAYATTAEWFFLRALLFSYLTGQTTSLYLLVDLSHTLRRTVSNKSQRRWSRHFSGLERVAVAGKWEA